MRVPCNEEVLKVHAKSAAFAQDNSLHRVVWACPHMFDTLFHALFLAFTLCRPVKSSCSATWSRRSSNCRRKPHWLSLLTKVSSFLVSGTSPRGCSASSQPTTGTGRPFNASWAVEKCVETVSMLFSIEQAKQSLSKPDMQA